ncbi:MAG: glucans biosynthesis glucosyltransferase MdoH [Pseudomonadota bacterium]
MASAGRAMMPSPAPLDMPTQDFRQAPVSDRLPSGQHTTSEQTAKNKRTAIIRALVILPAVLTVAALMAIFYDWFEKHGFVAAEIVMMVLVGFSSFWVALSVSMGTVGLLMHRKAQKPAPASPLNALDVALLVPIYNEDCEAVAARVETMVRALERETSHHRFAFFVLSDTRDDALAFAENQAVRRLRAKAQLPVFYRRRNKNTDRKTGNIRNWIAKWGGAWDAFITLDADSLMASAAIIELADDLASKPRTALIQTVPRLMGAETLFARALQFSNNIYGPLLARGLNLWSGDSGNYWGHNAIIRCKAFAACAGLPQLAGRGPLSGTIKSHDFVEAALLRRAGWHVTINPDIEASYEEVPQTITDYVLRDRRWCQGNLQHLRLLGIKGLHPVSRMHMLQGAMAYIASASWFALLIVWALLGRSEEETVFRYFTDTNPLFPVWPQMDAVSRGVVLGFMLGLLLLPKVFGIIATWRAEPQLKRHGGPVRFAASAACEIVLAVLIAPIMMVQHVIAMGRTLLRRDTGWAPQNRSGTRFGWLSLVRFHGVETAAGITLLVLFWLGVISAWLLPIALTLSLSVPFAMALNAKTSALRGVLRGLMATPEIVKPQAIITAFRKTVAPSKTRAAMAEPKTGAGRAAATPTASLAPWK